MRKIALAAAIAGAALTLTACSEGTEDAADGTAKGAMSEADAVEGGERDRVEAGAVLDANTATAAQLAGAAGSSPSSPKRSLPGGPMPRWWT